MSWKPKTIQERGERLLLNRSQVQLAAQEATTDSIERNLRHTDQLTARWQEQQLRLLYPDAEASEEEEMGDRYYGDVVTENHHHTRPISSLARVAAVTALGLSLPCSMLVWHLSSIVQDLQARVVATATAPGLPPSPPAIDTTLDVGLRGGTVIED